MSSVAVKAPTRQEHATKINQAYHATLHGVFETGRRILAAKRDLRHGEFEEMIKADLPFGARHARRLMAIAGDERLANRTHESDFASKFPGSVGTLYEITRLDDDQLEQGLDEGWISPETERKHISLRLKAKKREERVEELAERTEKASIGAEKQKYGVILMDPAWEHVTYDAITGGSRAAANHYPVMSLEEIKQIPVAEWAAPDCVIFMWATAPHLAQAMEVLAAYGFEYKSGAVWAKEKHTTGYWFWIQHEHVLVAVRGDVPAPAMGTQISSLIRSPSGDHSVKPDDIHHYIDRLYPGVPKLEMNARRAWPGWDTWGNEAPLDEPVEVVDPETGEITETVPAAEMPDLPDYLKRQA